MAQYQLNAFGSADFTELFRPKPVGEKVNTHVVPAVPEPKPDYAAMQRLIDGGEKATPPIPSAPEEPKK
jgi:hypothetical protein